MTVEGTTVKHCGKKGKVIKKHKTKGAALAHHGAIMANKKKKKK